MQTQSALQRVQILRLLRQFCEDPHLHGTQKHLGSPESQADLHDVFRCWLIAQSVSASLRSNVIVERVVPKTASKMKQTEGSLGNAFRGRAFRPALPSYCSATERSASSPMMGRE